MTRRSPCLTAALVSGAALAACSSAPTRFYTIDPRAPQATLGDYSGPAYRIDAVHIPPALDRPELVREGAADRLFVQDQDRWAAPLGDLFRRALTQDLAARFPSGKIIFPDAPKPPGTGGVVIDILAIAPSAGNVAMDVSWSILPLSASPTASSAAVAFRTRTVRLTTQSQGTGPGATAAQFADLADSLAQAVAADLQGASQVAPK